MKKNKKGFTLVELVIVVAVMAVLVAVAIPTVTSITKTAKDAVANTNAKTIESTIKLAEADKNKNGDVLQELTDAEIKKALEDAKLGIDAGSKFVYNQKTGVVEFVTIDNKNVADKQADAVGEYDIEFGASNVVTVTPYTATQGGGTDGDDTGSVG